ncbi:MAG: pyridoxamine kinase, partial [Clostridiales bacterium]|nr:pyridoxamine kinase [Clostridiales bacterium]
MIKRVAAVHDLAGLGRCSLTAIIPILSAMGVQCCPVPTAILSTQTGGYSDYSFFDMTEELKPYIEHWKSRNERFDSIYTGFLGSADQISMVNDFIRDFRHEDCIVMVDPVLGDNGEAYATCDALLCSKMYELAKCADIITPNLTEAAILLGESYSNAPTDEKGIKLWLKRLSDLGPRHIVITGLSKGKDKLAVAVYDKSTGNAALLSGNKVGGDYPGTGDIFASVLLGGLLSGGDLFKCTRQAMDFVHDSVKYTFECGSPVREGLLFEHTL